MKKLLLIFAVLPLLSLTLLPFLYQLDANNLEEGLRAYKSGDYTTAYEKFRPLGPKSFIQAQYHLGIMYELGLGIEKDAEKAVKWYTLAAEQGDAGAQYKLASMYERGEGVEKSEEEATKWYKIAFEKYLSLAQKKNDPHAQMQLSNIYRDGKGVEKNKEEATKWYDLALENYFSLAQEGNADARMELGDMYRDGKGVEKNKKESDEWYSLAFESYLLLAQKKNNSKARMQVAKMYEIGQGVERNYAETIKWYKLAFKSGYKSVAIILGNTYHVGDLGTKKDLPRALMWYILAKNKVLKNNLEKEMTPEQVKEAKRLVRACKKSKYTEC